MWDSPDASLDGGDNRRCLNARLESAHLRAESRTEKFGYRYSVSAPKWSYGGAWGVVNSVSRFSVEVPHRRIGILADESWPVWLVSCWFDFHFRYPQRRALGNYKIKVTSPHFAKIVFASRAFWHFWLVAETIPVEYGKSILYL